MVTPMPSSDEIAHAVKMLRLLAEPTRLAILLLTSEKELSVGAIAEIVDRSPTAVSQHLAKLRAGGLVRSRREGTTVYYDQPHWHVHQLVTNIMQQTEHDLNEGLVDHRYRA